MRYFLVLLFVCSLPFIGSAQINVKGKSPYNLKTMVFPGHNYRVKIDGKLQPAVNLFTVPKGKHYIEIWAPNYERFDTALYFSSKLIVLPIILKKSRALLEYEEAMEKSKKSMRISAACFGGVIIASGIAYYNYGRIGTLNADRIKATNGADHGLAKYSEGEKTLAKRKHTNAQILQGALYIGAGALAYNAIRHLIKAKRIKVPMIKEDKSFLVDGGFFITPEGNWQTGLVLKF